MGGLFPDDFNAEVELVEGIQAAENRAKYEAERKKRTQRRKSTESG